MAESKCEQAAVRGSKTGRAGQAPLQFDPRATERELQVTLLAAISEAAAGPKLTTSETHTSQAPLRLFVDLDPEHLGAPAGAVPLERRHRYQGKAPAAAKLSGELALAFSGLEQELERESQTPSGRRWLSQARARHPLLLSVLGQLRGHAHYLQQQADKFAAAPAEAPATFIASILLHLVPAVRKDGAWQIPHFDPDDVFALNLEDLKQQEQKAKQSQEHAACPANRSAEQKANEDVLARAKAARKAACKSLAV